MNTLIENNIINTTVNQLDKKKEKLNVIIRKKETKAQLAKYLYAVYSYPTISTFTKAIANNNFILWPGLTPQLILKHLSKTICAY